MVIVFALTLLLAILVEIIARDSGTTPPYWALHASGGFPVMALGGVFLIHLFRYAGNRERLLLVAYGTGSVAVLHVAFNWCFLSDWSLAGHALALGSILTHLDRCLAGRRGLADAAKKMCAQWLLVVATMMAPFFLEQTMALHPTYDRPLLAFEEGLGLRIASNVHVALTAVPALGAAVWLIYLAVPGLMALHFASSRARGPNLPFLFTVSGGIGFLFYFLYPAVGPWVAYPDYFQSASAADPSRIFTEVTREQMASAPRSCMPSLHAVWGYFLLLCSGGLPRWQRWLFGAAGVVTLFGALDAGHWFIDLVVAWPFAMAILSVSDGSEMRIEPCPLLCGVILVSCWILALSSHWFISESPGWARWLCIVATLIVSWHMRPSCIRLGPEPARPPRAAA